MKFRYAVLVKTERVNNSAEYGILLGKWFDEISEAHAYKEKWEKKAYINAPMFIVSCAKWMDMPNSKSSDGMNNGVDGSGIVP